MSASEKKSKKSKEWLEAQRRCGLSAEAVRMAKELGIGPRSLIKNIPNPRQRWKAPVEEWVRDLYAKLEQNRARRNHASPIVAAPASLAARKFHGTSHPNCAIRYARPGVKITVIDGQTRSRNYPSTTPAVHRNCPPLLGH